MPASSGAPALQCHRCNASFTDLRSLHEHKMEVHGTRTFQCPICPLRGFRREDLWTKHAQTNHAKAFPNLTLDDFRLVLPASASAPLPTTQPATPSGTHPVRGCRSMSNLPRTPAYREVVEEWTRSVHFHHHHVRTTTHFPDGRRTVVDDTQWWAPQELSCCLAGPPSPECDEMTYPLTPGKDHSPVAPHLTTREERTSPSRCERAPTSPSRKMVLASMPIESHTECLEELAQPSPQKAKHTTSSKRHKSSNSSKSQASSSFSRSSTGHSSRSSTGNSSRKQASSSSRSAASQKSRSQSSGEHHPPHSSSPPRLGLKATPPSRPVSPAPPACQQPSSSNHARTPSPAPQSSSGSSFSWSASCQGEKRMWYSRHMMSSSSEDDSSDEEGRQF